jgi:hypothetical protein
LLACGLVGLGVLDDESGICLQHPEA